MPEYKNMCDGCERKLPIVEGMHKESSTYGWTYCTKDRYQPTTEEELRKKYNKFWGYNMCNQREFDEIADWWLERHEYDGSEWWEFKKLPKKPENYQVPSTIHNGDSWATLVEMNREGGKYART